MQSERGWGGDDGDDELKAKNILTNNIKGNI